MHTYSQSAWRMHTRCHIDILFIFTTHAPSSTAQAIPEIHPKESSAGDSSRQNIEIYIAYHMPKGKYIYVKKVPIPPPPPPSIYTLNNSIRFLFQHSIVYRNRHHFICIHFCNWVCPSVISKICICLRKMRRNGIMNNRTNPIFIQIFYKFISFYS